MINATLKAEYSARERSGFPVRFALIGAGLLLSGGALLGARHILPAATAPKSQTTNTPITNATTIRYVADNSVFPNPERGFYIAYQPTGGGRVGQQDTPHPPLKFEELRALRSRPEAITLIRDTILIPRKFWNQPISAEYLRELESNFDAVRRAGLKTVPRFLYDWGMQNRDADEATIKRHLKELTPLLQKNADIIAWMQGGLFGGTGEGNASDHGYVYQKHPAPGGNMRWQGLSEAGRRLLLLEMSILPKDRMLNVRYPRLKWDMFGWNSGNAMSRVLLPTTAFSGSDAARVGYYNDGFMGSPEHYAMFQLRNEADFTARDSEFVVHEGEISDATSYKLQNDQVRRDMARYRVTALNCGGDSWPEVMSFWKRNGDYDEVARRMGYRFRLLDAKIPTSLRAGSTLNLSLRMTNDGYTRAMNPRGVAIVLREQRSGAEYSLAVNMGKGNRLWLPGPGTTQTLTVSGGLPATLPTGNYAMFLHLPDPKPALYNRPEYSVRLANKNVWEDSSGYNRLNHTLHVHAQASGQKYSGAAWFKPKAKRAR